MSQLHEPRCGTSARSHLTCRLRPGGAHLDAGREPATNRDLLTTGAQHHGTAGQLRHAAHQSAVPDSETDRLRACAVVGDGTDHTLITGL